MGRFSLEEYDEDEDSNSIDEPSHPVGFGVAWGRTYFSLDPVPSAMNLRSPSRSTYSLDFHDFDDEDFFDRRRHQSFPSLSSYVDSRTAPTSMLLRSNPARDADWEDDDASATVSTMVDDCGDDDGDVMLLQQLMHQVRLKSEHLYPPSPAAIPNENSARNTERIQQKMKLERQRMDTEHARVNEEVGAMIKSLERKAARKEKARKEEQLVQKQQQEEKEKRISAENEKREHETRALEAKQNERKERELNARREKERREEEKGAALSKKTEYVTKAKKLVAQLVQVRASIEPFEKNKAVSKRRLGMKKIVRGKVNTLSENSSKIQEVAATVSAAITQARTDDDNVKKALERKDPGFSSDMARGKRYLVDLLASGFIQRIQAEGFNGARGDGFPLASMLAMVSLQNKELVPILAAHIYTVCPTAIPTLPSPKEGATEEELMSSLGMLKGKNGEYESFDRFLSRTESIVAAVADIMAVSPSTHVLMGGHKSAVEWLERFLRLLPAPPTAPLPLLTAPVLYGFLSGAGHMLANQHPEAFKKQIDTISKDVLSRLDEGSIGKPSSIRLAKFVDGGFGKFRSELPSKALPDLYYGATGGNTASSHRQQSKQFEQRGTVVNSIPAGGNTQAPSNPFGANPTHHSMFNSASSGTNPSQATPFGGATSVLGNSPFGTLSSASTGLANQPFGQSSMENGVGFNSYANHVAQQPSPFANTSDSPFGTETSATPFGIQASPVPTTSFGSAPAPSPFGGGNNSTFGGGNNSPFGGGTNSTFGNSSQQMSSPFGQGSQQSPFGQPNQTQSSFGHQSRPPQGRNAQQGKNGRPKICKFFQKNGSCRYGNNCQFSHETGNQNSGGNFANSNSSRENSANSRGRNGQQGGGRGSGRPTPCRYFQQNGSCRFGSNCKFSHDTARNEPFGSHNSGMGNFNDSNSMGGGGFNNSMGGNPFGAPRR